MQTKVLQKYLRVTILLFLITLPLSSLALESEGITNPLGNVNTITGVLKNIINWMLGLVGIIALIALITAGGRMILGFLDEDQVKRAKTTILWAVIGLAVVILSYAIINIVTTEVLGTESGSSYENNPGSVKLPNSSSIFYYVA